MVTSLYDGDPAETYLLRETAIWRISLARTRPSSMVRQTVMAADWKVRRTTMMTMIKYSNQLVKKT